MSYETHTIAGTEYAILSEIYRSMFMDIICTETLQGGARVCFISDCRIVEIKGYTATELYKLFQNYDDKFITLLVENGVSLSYLLKLSYDRIDAQRELHRQMGLLKFQVKQKRTFRHIINSIFG